MRERIAASLACNTQRIKQRRATVPNVRTVPPPQALTYVGRVPAVAALLQWHLGHAARPRTKSMSPAWWWGRIPFPRMSTHDDNKSLSAMSRRLMSARTSPANSERDSAIAMLTCGRRYGRFVGVRGGVCGE